MHHLSFCYLSLGQLVSWSAGQLVKNVMSCEWSEEALVNGRRIRYTTAGLQIVIASVSPTAISAGIGNS